MIELIPKEQNQIEFNDDDLVCYCFEYTKKDIENDFNKNGKSLIHQKILYEKKTGGCNLTSRWRRTRYPSPPADLDRLFHGTYLRPVQGEKAFTVAAVSLPGYQHRPLPSRGA